MLISGEEALKNQLEPGQESMAVAPVLLHCSLLRNLWPKPTGVLEHCRDGETKIFDGSNPDVSRNYQNRVLSVKHNLISQSNRN